MRLVLDDLRTRFVLPVDRKKRDESGGTFEISFDLNRTERAETRRYLQDKEKSSGCWSEETSGLQDLGKS